MHHVLIVLLTEAGISAKAPHATNFLPPLFVAGAGKASSLSRFS
jgi:hypothetical protein